MGASVIIALPMFGDYYTPNIISGSPKTSMLATRSTSISTADRNLPWSGFTLILSAFLGVLMAYYVYTVSKAQREAQP